MVDRPGKCSEELILTPSRRSKEGQKGLVSSITFSSEGIYAVGTYSGGLGIYDQKTNQALALFNSQHQQGVSQVLFSPDGHYLVSSGRKDNWITAWDIRAMGRELYHFERPINTHQRTRFSIKSHFLVVGDQVNMFWACENFL
jgi:WD40 repeat protein